MDGHCDFRDPHPRKTNAPKSSEDQNHPSSVPIWRFPKNRQGVPPVVIHFKWDFPISTMQFWGTPFKRLKGTISPWKPRKGTPLQQRLQRPWPAVRAAPSLSRGHLPCQNCKHVRTKSYLCIHMYIYICVCVCDMSCVCKYAYIYTYNIYILCIYIYIDGQIDTSSRLISHHAAEGTSCVAGAEKNTEHITPLKSHHEQCFLQ